MKWFFICVVSVLLTLPVTAKAQFYEISDSLDQKHTVKDRHTKNITDPFFDEPIFAIGHGSAFNADMQVINIDTKFLNDSLQYYTVRILELLELQQQNIFYQNRAKYDFKSEYIFDTGQVKWLNFEHQIINVTTLKMAAKKLSLKDGGALVGKMKFLDSKIREQKNFKISKTLKSLLPPHLDTVDTMPPPPPPGCPSPGVWPTDYTSNGIQEVSFAGVAGEVWVKEDEDGVCIGLPRKNPLGMISAFGVICQNSDGNACFWDNQDENGDVFDVNPDSTVSISGSFAQGEDLFDGQGGICTDCHAGENAYIIHPDTNLLPPESAENGYDITPDAWYVPRVHDDWPQNPGPGTKLINLPSASVCAGCHGGNSSLRYPKLEGLDEYCGIMRTSIGLTMPPLGSPSVDDPEKLKSDITDLCNGIDPTEPDMPSDAPVMVSDARFLHQNQTVIIDVLDNDDPVVGSLTLTGLSISPIQMPEPFIATIEDNKIKVITSDQEYNGTIYYTAINGAGELGSGALDILIHP